MIKSRLLKMLVDPERLLAALFGLTLLVVLGSLLPQLYFRYFDNTAYVVVKQPIPVDKKEYHACETITMLIDRTSQFDAAIDGQYEITLVHADQNYETIKSEQLRFILNKGHLLTLYRITIPCDITAGNYFIKGVYYYKYNGRDRSYPLVSDFFQIL